MAFPDTQLSTPLFVNGFVDAPLMEANVTANLNALAARVADTGWQPLGAVTSTFTAGVGNATPMYRAIGSQVWFRGTFSLNTGNASLALSSSFSANIFSTLLPAQLRPAVQMIYVATINTGAAGARFEISVNSDGSVTTRNSGSAAGVASNNIGLWPVSYLAG